MGATDVLLHLARKTCLVSLNCTQISYFSYI